MATTSLLTSVIRINSPALLVSYNLGHRKGWRAPKPFLQEEKTKKLFAVTKDENLFIFAQIHHLQSDFIMKRTNVLLKFKGLFTRGLSHKLIQLQSLPSFTTSTTTAAAPRSPSATFGHVHGPVRLLRPPRHALHRRWPAAPQDRRRRRHLQH